MSRGLQGAGSQTWRAWAIEAAEGVVSGERLWALIIGMRHLSLRTVSVEYLGSHSREWKREWGKRE